MKYDCVREENTPTLPGGIGGKLGEGSWRGKKRGNERSGRWRENISVERGRVIIPGSYVRKMVTMRIKVFSPVLGGKLNAHNSSPKLNPFSGAELMIGSIKGGNACICWEKE